MAWSLFESASTTFWVWTIKGRRGIIYLSSSFRISFDWLCKCCLFETTKWGYDSFLQLSLFDRWLMRSSAKTELLLSKEDCELLAEGSDQSGVKALWKQIELAPAWKWSIFWSILEFSSGVKHSATFLAATINPIFAAAAHVLSSTRKKLRYLFIVSAKAVLKSIRDHLIQLHLSILHWLQVNGRCGYVQKKCFIWAKDDSCLSNHGLMGIRFFNYFESVFFSHNQLHGIYRIIAMHLF